MKLTQNSFFQAQTDAKQVPIEETRDLLHFFKAHTLPKHIQCFKKWQKLRCSDLSEILRITDQPNRRARALDLETYIHAMFPTEQYTVVTLLHKDFSREVAHSLIQAFEQADGQTRL